LDSTRTYILVRKKTGNDKDASGLNIMNGVVNKFNQGSLLAAVVEHDTIRYAEGDFVSSSTDLNTVSCGKLSWHSSVLQSTVSGDTRFVYAMDNLPASGSEYETISCGSCNPAESVTSTSRRLLSFPAATTKASLKKKNMFSPKRVKVEFGVKHGKITHRRLLNSLDLQGDNLEATSVFVTATVNSNAATTLSQNSTGVVTSDLQPYTTPNAISISIGANDNSGDEANNTLVAILVALLSFMFIVLVVVMCYSTNYGQKIIDKVDQKLNNFWNKNPVPGIPVVPGYPVPEPNKTYLTTKGLKNKTKRVQIVL